MSPERWQQIEELFQAAVELPINDRKEFLDAKCASDDELRLEVERLLRSDESAEDFIESPIWTDSSFLNTSAKKELSDSFVEPSERVSDNYLGRIIGAFRLKKEIGRGGMGAVYLAERADGEFQQRVAVKLIKRGMDSDFIIRRFRHERQILASFEHPFIARLLDGGTTSDGVPYFVMEYVEGETFYNYSDTNRLTIRERLKIFQKVCSALEYAHSRQIIHRDIKPSNILIDRGGSPKLLDFGIAKILDPNLIHESLNPTASMLRMMTPDYASPEQVRGADVTPSSDIYSLGVLLYEFLTGHRPYNFAGRALHEVSNVICSTMPKLPSRIIKDRDNLLPHYANRNGDFLESRKTTATALAADLGRDLDDIVMKALSKEPDDRYSSVAELSKDISRHLNGVKVLAPKYSPERAVRAETFPRVPTNTKSLAVLPFSFLNLVSSEDTDDRFLGMGLADALITRLSKIKRFVVRPTSSIMSFGDGPIDPVAAGRELNVDFILNGSIKKANDRLRVTVQLLYVAENAAIWATSIDEGLGDVFSLEDKLASKVVEGLLPQLTADERDEFVKRGTDDPEAFEHYLRGRYYFNTFTEESFAKAFVSFHSAISADSEYAHAYAGLADYYNWLGIMGVLSPQECFRPATEAAKRAVELDENLSEAHASLGFCLHAGNYEWSRAEHHLKRAIELNPSNSNAYVWYSMVMYTEGRFAEGLKYAERGVEIDPLAPFNHHNVAWGLYYARRYDEAASAYRKMIADFPEYSFGYYGLSKVLRLKGDTKAAIHENSRAMELLGNSVFSLLSEAECYAADGQRDVASQKIAGLEKQSRDRYVSPYQLALVYCYLGETNTALDQLEKAAELREGWLNWAGVEPVFDSLRGDPRFEKIVEDTGYRPFFSSFATLSKAAAAEQPESQDLHNLTTLVIEDGDITADGIFTPAARRTWKRGYLAAAAMTIILLAGVSLGIYFYAKSTAVMAPPARVVASSIVVLPFLNADSGISDIGTGLADDLTNKLGNIKSLQVISSNTGRALAKVDPAKLDTELGIAYVLKGSIGRSGNAVTGEAELWDTRAGNIVFREEFAAPDGNLFSLQTRLAERVWTALGVDPLPNERQQVERSYTESIAAYQLYLRGRSEMTDRSVESLTSAVRTFSSSIREDPNFALAYVGLADALSLLNLYSVDPPEGSYDEAKRNLTRALELDPNLAEAHATLAYVKFFHDRDRNGSELEFRRAIQINPSYAPAHHWFALTLAAKGKKADAQTEIAIAKKLDPRSAAIRAAAGVVYFQLGDFARAISESDAALALDVRSIPAYKVKRWAFTTMGDRSLAAVALGKEMEYSGGSAEDCGWRIIRSQIEAIGSSKAPLLQKIDECARDPFIKSNPSGYGYEIALAFNSIGETQRAIEWIERSEAAGSHSFNYAGVDPRFANLRELPAFTALLKKLTR